ncbi:hypothetical protein LX99_02796 [Mucilaginibacter oryzae]|uniref:Uncharacterized protein n=1 Tax=Mucilaginibacter oryzae TaxID=468058 RepID=A0A316HD24_9SPHI|nr:hypothetical protein [Mucilaginibacter oryzae]PWK77911.1 hypothetical protein LX99_02796 [Mucilaginibacter oryzae]
MYLQSLLVAEEGLRDYNSNKISLINIIDSVSATAFPLSLEKFVVFALAYREATDLEIYQFSGTLFIYNNDELLKSSDFNFKFGEKNVMRYLSRWSGVVFQSPGTCRIVMKFENGTTKEVYFELKKIDK